MHARMLWIDQARGSLCFTSSFITANMSFSPSSMKHLGVTLVRLLHLDVAEVHVVDTVTGPPNPAADIDGVDRRSPASHRSRT